MPSERKRAKVPFVRIGEPGEVFEAMEGWSQIAAGEWRGMWVRSKWLCEDGN